jgi:hypothetical protein
VIFDQTETDVAFVNYLVPPAAHSPARRIRSLPHQGPGAVALRCNDSYTRVSSAAMQRSRSSIRSGMSIEDRRLARDPLTHGRVDPRVERARGV